MKKANNFQIAKVQPQGVAYITITAAVDPWHLKVAVAD